MLIAELLNDLVGQIAGQFLVEARAGRHTLHAPVLHVLRDDRPHMAAARRGRQARLRLKLWLSSLVVPEDVL